MYACPICYPGQQLTPTSLRFLSATADVFSFGILLWQLLTSEPVPYKDLSVPQILLGVAQGTVGPGRGVGWGARSAQRTHRWLLIMGWYAQMQWVGAMSRCPGLQLLSICGAYRYPYRSSRPCVASLPAPPRCPPQLRPEWPPGAHPALVKLGRACLDARVEKRPSFEAIVKVRVVRT